MSAGRAERPSRSGFDAWLRPIAAVLMVGGLVVAVWVYAIFTLPDVVPTHVEYVRTGCGPGNPYSRATWNFTFTFANTGGVDGIAMIQGVISSNVSGQTTLRVPRFGQATGWLLAVGPDCKTNRTAVIEVVSVTPA